MERMRRVAVVVLALAAPAWAKEPVEKEADPKLVAAVEAAVRTAGKGEFWGTVLVAKEGKVLLAKGYGFADYEKEKRPNAPDTLFEIASASKQVTATAILRLEQKKKLKTSDHLGTFFPKAPKDKRAVTLDHLLHHTAGLDPTLGVPYSWAGSRDQYVEQMLDRPLVEKPGKKFAYSNVGYALLAAVVEEVSGQEFEDYVRKELFAPAGLEDTGFVGDAKLKESDRITVRKADDMQPHWTAADWWYGWGYRGMGGVITTALDLVKWDRALRGDKILKPAQREKLYTPALDKYACGWIVDRGERGGTKVSHSGGVRGYACQIARWLEDDLLIVVLSNGIKSNPHEVEAAVARAVFANG
jgi:CubicO group peptidase (beta-lactamase class C family)